jgi:c(7)-type cytochrome triheme protein
MGRSIVLLLFCVCLAVPATALAQKVGGGDLTFTPANAGPVVFSHAAHVKAGGIKCSACHYQIFQMTKGSSKIDMSKITKGSFCGNCHNGQKAFDVKDEKNCSRCHH